VRRGLALGTSVTAVLVVAAGASAHVTMKPAFVESNVPGRVVLETPNERPGRATVRLRVTTSPGVRVLSASAPAGWRVTSDAHSATWSGGRITGARVERFPVELEARVRAGTYAIDAVQRYDDGRAVRWSTQFTVLPSSGSASPQEHARRAFVAAGAGILIIVLSLVALHRLRRRSLQDS
jgi:periplasmic copper chaperone A